MTREEREGLAARRVAADAAYARVVERLRQPLTWQQRRAADRAAGVARRLEQLAQNRRRGIR